MGTLDFGSAFSRVIDLYGRYAAPLLIWSAIFQGGLAVLVAVFVAGFLGGTGSAVVVGIVVLALGVIAAMLMTGAYIVGLDEAERTGTFPAFADVWPRVSPRLGALVITGLIAALATGIGFLLLLVPGLILLTWWAVASPVVMLEGRSGMDALARSRELVRGNGWTVFGLVIVVTILAGVASSIVERIIGAVVDSDTIVGAFLGQFVSGTLFAPISALLAVVMYQALTGSGADGEEHAPPAPAVEPPATPGGTGPFV